MLTSMAMGACAFVVFTLVGLGLRSQYLDRHDAGVAKQLEKQKIEESEYARKPFEPELSSASLAAENVTLAGPLAAKGKAILGAAAASALVGLSKKVNASQLSELFSIPQQR